MPIILLRASLCAMIWSSLLPTGLEQLSELLNATESYVRQEETEKREKMPTQRPWGAGFVGFHFHGGTGLGSDHSPFFEARASSSISLRL